MNVTTCSFIEWYRKCLKYPQVFLFIKASVKLYVYVIVLKIKYWRDYILALFDLVANIAKLVNLKYKWFTVDMMCY